MTASAGSALPHGATAERKLDEFLAKFTPEIAELARAARAKMQAFLPGARFDFRANQHWNVQGSFVLSRGEGYHEYDNAQSEFLVSYTRAMHQISRDTGGGQAEHPMRFAFGLQQQTFYDFDGMTKTAILPVVHFNLF